jgi:calnexin
MEGDKGLVVKDKAAHHAISAKFAKPINPKNKPLVVQYEVKLQGEPLAPLAERGA